MPIGNCFQTPLKQIFMSPEYFDFCHKLASLDGSQLPACCKLCGVMTHVKQ